MRRVIMIQAITGFVVWLVSYSLLNIGQIERLLLFAILVIVPLVLTLVETKDRQGKQFMSYVLAIYLYPVGSLMAFVSFFFPPGLVAGMLSMGWLLWTGVVFVYGLSRLMARGLSYLEEISIDVGIMYLLLGGGWLSLFQFGIDVWNFGSLIILLTAIHFHYSAFITPIFLGLLGRVLKANGSFQKMYKIAAIGVMVSPIGVAIGITYSRFIEFVFVVVFVACLWAYTYLVLVHLRKINNRAAYLLISASAIILLFTMFLAFLYGLGRLLHVDYILIPDMVTLHGIGNAFGFVFVGVLGWLLLSPKMNVDVYGIPFSKIVGKWKIGARFFARNQLEASKEIDYKGLIDQFSLFGEADFDSQKVNPHIRSFYENTLAFQLTSTTYWHKGFRLLSKLYKKVSRIIEQINLPLHEEDELKVESQLIAIDSNQDGRENPRAWVRIDSQAKKAVFVAIYSYHVYHDHVYLNIALPLPFGQMTGILRMENMEKEQSDGLVLTSQSKRGEKGDEGIYYVT